MSFAEIETYDADEPVSTQRRWTPTRYGRVERGTFAGRFRELNVDGIGTVSEQQNRTVLKRQKFPADTCSVSVIRDIPHRGDASSTFLTSRPSATRWATGSTKS